MSTRYDIVGKISLGCGCFLNKEYSFVFSFDTYLLHVSLVIQSE